MRFSSKDCSENVSFAKWMVLNVIFSSKYREKKANYVKESRKNVIFVKWSRKITRISSKNCVISANFGERSWKIWEFLLRSAEKTRILLNDRGMYANFGKRKDRGKNLKFRQRIVEKMWISSKQLGKKCEFFQNPFWP